jgi:hypothetical protein
MTSNKNNEHTEEELDKLLNSLNHKELIQKEIGSEAEKLGETELEVLKTKTIGFLKKSETMANQFRKMFSSLDLNALHFFNFAYTATLLNFFPS